MTDWDSSKKTIDRSERSVAADRLLREDRNTQGSNLDKRIDLLSKKDRFKRDLRQARILKNNMEASRPYSSNSPSESSEKVLTKKQDQDSFRSAIIKLFEMLKGDKIARAILICILEEDDPRSNKIISEKIGVSIQQVNSAKARIKDLIRRKISANSMEDFVSRFSKSEHRNG